MWPWEHAIAGYVAYSLFCHLRYRDSPGGLEAFAAVFGSLLPDLVDKPLAWEYGVFETGYALGHSVFVAVPASIAVGLLARRRGRGRAGIAFAIGYLLHPPGDVFYDYVMNDSLSVRIMLWPVERGVASGEPPGLLAMFWHFFGRYRAEFAAEEPSTYLLAQLGVAIVAGCLWLYDGAPVLRECAVVGKRAAARLLGGAASRSRSPGKRE